MIEVRLNPDVTPAGSDLSIVNAARRSFNTRSDWANQYDRIVETYSHDTGNIYHENPDWKAELKEKDKRLLQFLARGMTAYDWETFLTKFSNRRMEGVGDYEEVVLALWQWRNTPTHDTPFNHTFISFEVKAPIFVRAQLVKHEYLIVSEFSRRYITDDIEFYAPKKWRKAAENKKQGSSNEAVESMPVSKNGKDTLGHPSELVTEMSYGMVLLYDELLKVGVAPEQARMVLPQSTMTEWTWSGTLGAFAKMCQLRLHPEAQYEVRLVAQQVYDYLKEYYPVAAKALVEGVDV